jgi:hypothetical protein
MRRLGVIMACLALALLMSGCDPNDKVYFRDGIGTDLYTANSLEATNLQNIYLDNLCRQSLPYVGLDVPSCAGQGQLPATAWPLIVQAGMNDIDLRCDSYLSWLDQKKRENAATLSEIGAVRVAVDALTNPAIATTISPVALASVAAAFGLATSTLSNVNSLLLQVDHTTVQSVVFVNRREFRQNMLKLAISSKPMVIHALRSYLEICMPMTISANINSTVTVFQQTSGVMERQPLVSTSTIQGGPLTAQQTISKPPRSTLTVHQEFAAILDPYDPHTQSVDFVKSLQRALCVPNSEIGTMHFDDTIALIKIYEATKSATISRPAEKNNGKLDTDEIGDVLASGACAKDQKNYFEKQTFKNNPRGQKALADFIAALNNVPGGTQRVADTSLDSARARIKEVRGLPSISGLLILDLPGELTDQVTPDLYLAVMKK